MLKYADMFDVSMDYLYGRTDNPHGMYYSCKTPEVEKSYPDLKKEALRFNLFQRLEYLLHIPIRQMTKSDNYYLSVVKYVRRHYFLQMLNPYLTFKNKIYLCLLGAAPRTVRVVHARLKGWDY